MCKIKWLFLEESIFEISLFQWEIKQGSKTLLFKGQLFFFFFEKWVGKQKFEDQQGPQRFYSSEDHLAGKCQQLVKEVTVARHCMYITIEKPFVVAQIMFSFWWAVIVNNVEITLVVSSV